MEQILVRMPKELKDKIVKEAEKKGIGRNGRKIIFMRNAYRQSG